jgi:hypothetical protein
MEKALAVSQRFDRVHVFYEEQLPKGVYRFRALRCAQERTVESERVLAKETIHGRNPANKPEVEHRRPAKT